MTAFSALRGVHRFNLIRSLLKANKCGNGVSGVRGFQEREFPMRPSVFQWRKFKDLLHFYSFIGYIPLAIITVYVNVMVGPAELTETPEGYEPKHWEYYKSPISRFFAQHLIRDKRIDYESMVCYLNEEAEKAILKRMERMVKDFMKYRNDYKSWFYRPIDGYQLRYEREEWKNYRDHLGGFYADVATQEGFSDGGTPK